MGMSARKAAIHSMATASDALPAGYQYSEPFDQGSCIGGAARDAGADGVTLYLGNHRGRAAFRIS